MKNKLNIKEVDRKKKIRVEIIEIGNKRAAEIKSMKQKKMVSSIEQQD